METAESFYSDNTGGERYIILSDMEQVMPSTRCKVTGAVKRKSSSGKEFPVLTIEDTEGNSYSVSAWARDVAACIKQWGTGNPVGSWGYIGFEKKANRYRLIPHENQLPDVEEVSA
jgi:hypothetical protein